MSRCYKGRYMNETNIKFTPYLNESNIKWPVITIKAPVLLTAPKGYENVASSLSIRLPKTLDSTIELHCATMGALKSAWVRRAILHLLSHEQQWLKQRENEHS